MARLRDLVAAHGDATQTGRAREILDDWACRVPLFWKVVPHGARARTPAAQGPQDGTERR